MQPLQIQKSLSTGRMVIPVAILITILLRIHAGVNLLSENAIILLVHIGIALLLMQMNYIFTIIRNRTMFPAMVYLLFVATDSSFFTNLIACGITLGFVLCFFCTLYSYQNEKSQVNLFNIAILLSIGTFFWEPTILFLPFFWLAFLKFKALNWKSFMASILGIFVVCLFTFAWILIDAKDITHLQEEMPSSEKVLNYKWTIPNWEEIIRFIYTAILVLFSFIHMLSTSFSEKVRSFSFLYFFFLFIIATVILSFFFSQSRDIFFSIICVPSAIIISHFFALTKNKYFIYLLLFSILFYIFTYFGEFYNDYLISTGG